MPIYEFKCDGCGKTHELQLEVQDRDFQWGKCGKCGGTFQRVIGNCSFILKGSCWAKDGYATTYGDAVKATKHNKTIGE